MNQKKYVVFIDLDNTLLSVNSGKITVLAAYKNGLIKFFELLNAFFLSVVYKLNIRIPEKTVIKMAAWLGGMKEELIINLSKEIVDRELIPTVRPSMINEIKFHQKKGATVVLLSAALPYVCEPIAKFVGINEVICSSMEIKQGVFTGKPQGKICLGKEKLVRAQQYCEKNSLSLSEAYCYADSDSDKYILAASGYPICVSPDKKLRKRALKNNWKITE